MHIKWFNEDNNIVYDNPKEWPVTVKGIWKAYWYNTPEMGHKIAEEIYNKNIIIDVEKVYGLIQEKMQHGPDVNDDISEKLLN